MTTAQDEARRIRLASPMEFDNPHMIKARRLWAGVLERNGELADGDLELVKYFQVDFIRDRLMADVINPYVWDEAEYYDLFRGSEAPTPTMIDRMKAATLACRNLSELSEVEDHPPMLMLSTMMQWLVLNPGLALQGAQIALRIAPEYQIAQLMIQMIQGGVQPRWLTDA